MNKVFVHPQQYRSAVKACTKEVKQFCVIVAESLEYLVEESIATIGKGAWAKNRSPVDLLACNTSECASAGSRDGDYDGAEVAPPVKRTFVIRLDHHGQRSSTCRNSPHEACVWGASPEVLSLLLEYRADVNLKANTKESRELPMPQQFPMGNGMYTTLQLGSGGPSAVTLEETVCDAILPAGQWMVSPALGPM